MRRSVASRLIAFIIALLGSLSAPAQALTHGLVHDHLAHEHGQVHHADADHAARASGAPSDDHHAHGHATVDAVPGTRDLLRLGPTPAGPLTPPATAAPLAAVVVVRSPALTDRALLARPDPDGGPPPRLRAPPAR